MAPSFPKLHPFSLYLIVPSANLIVANMFILYYLKIEYFQKLIFYLKADEPLKFQAIAIFVIFAIFYSIGVFCTHFHIILYFELRAL